MIQLIVGTKGSGKTKTLVDMINAGTRTTSGNVVVIEKGMQLTYDIDHQARLVDMDEYHVAGADMFYGFVAGVLAGNYDITELYIDGVLKVLDHDLAALGNVLDQLNAIAGESLKLVVTVSADRDTLPESVSKYL